MRALLRRPVAIWFALAVMFAAAPAFADATVFLINGDAPGVGLNDPTPRAPVAGNTGTTVGQQRLIALQHAADIWGSQLDSPVPIGLIVSFGERACTPTGAVLASAGAWDAFANFPAVGNFPGPVRPDTWHHSALADKRAGAEVSPGEPDAVAIFNVNLGQPTCFAGPGWYYGLDGNEPAGAIDVVAVALHEFGHGLGFQQFANLTTGAENPGLFRCLRITPARHVEHENLGPDDGRRARGVRDQLAPAGVERHGGLRRRAISALVWRSGAHHHRARRHRRHIRGGHRHLRVAAHRGRHCRSDRPGARRGEPRRAVDHGRVLRRSRTRRPSLAGLRWSIAARAASSSRRRTSRLPARRRWSWPTMPLVPLRRALAASIPPSPFPRCASR